MIDLLWTDYSYKVHGLQPYIKIFKGHLMVSFLKGKGGYQGVSECKNMKNAHFDSKLVYSNFTCILA